MVGTSRTKPPSYETSVPGVFTVGDCGTPGKTVAQAIATDVFAAAGLVAELQEKIEKETCL